MGLAFWATINVLIRNCTFFQVTKHLRYNCVAVPADYEKLFKKALFTFRHQRVYDPNKEDIVHLTNILDDIGDEMDFLGPYPFQ